MKDATRNITISELPESERPREKMFKKGPKALSNAELLAIILGIELYDHIIIGNGIYVSLKEKNLF